MSVTPYPTLRLKLTQPQALKLNFRDGAGTIGSGNNSVTNAMLADMPAWTFKVRNDPAQGDPQNAGVSNFATATPGDSDYVIGFLSTGELRKYSSTQLKLAEAVIALTDGATVPLDASLGNMFHLIAAGNRTILAPSNAPGVTRTQKIIIRHQASGANRTLTLTSGAGGFRFGTTVTGLTATLNGTTDYIGAIWNQPASRWDIVAYAKGF
jgi:hypothetical protein